MSTKTLMTVQEFAQMQTAETEDYELVDGELVPLPSGTIRHAKIRDLIGHLLWSYFGTNPIGEAMSEIDCRLSDDTVRRPDVAIFLGKDRLSQLDPDRIPAPFSPDIAVEVLSPSEKAMDVRRKVRDYLRAGSKGSMAVGSCQRRSACLHESRHSCSAGNGYAGVAIAAGIYNCSG
jgi:Uma2 family endonuclease